MHVLMGSRQSMETIPQQRAATRSSKIGNDAYTELDGYSRLSTSVITSDPRDRKNPPAEVARDKVNGGYPTPASFAGITYWWA